MPNSTFYRCPHQQPYHCRSTITRTFYFKIRILRPKTL